MAKKSHYLLTLLLLLLCGFGARAQETTVTFTVGVDYSSTNSITKDNVTFSISDGFLDMIPYYKIAKNATATFSCSAGNITKIVLSCNDTRYGADELSLKEGGGEYVPRDYTTGTWTGNSASVTFQASSSVRRIQLVKAEVTYSTGSTPPTKQEPNLAFSAQTVSATLGFPFTAPTLTKPDDLAVSYSSSNTNVATVDASTGNVTTLSEGTTTITAKSEETDTYLAGEASYTLTVLALNGNGSTDYPYTVADLKKLEEIKMFPKSSVSVKGIISDIYAFFNTGYLNEIDYYISDDGTTANQYLVKGRGLDYAKFNAKEDLMVGSKVVLTGTPGPGEFNYDELTSIEVPVSIVDGEYATFYYGGFNLKMPAGVTATTYSYANNALTTSKTYNEGDVIPAKTAVVLKGNAATYYFQGTTETGETPIFSNLHGSDKDATTSVEGMGKYYMLSLNAQSDPASIGFYWGADGGGAFTSKAHKAYLALPASANVKGFAFNDVTNGITAKTTTTEQADAPVYSLTGLRMSGPLPAGVYVRNGKKFIVK